MRRQLYRNDCKRREEKKQKYTVGYLYYNIDYLALAIYGTLNNKRINKEKNLSRPHDPKNIVILYN